MPPSLRRLKTRPEFLRVAGARRSWVTPGVIVQAHCRACAEGPAGQADPGIEAGPGNEAGPDETIGVGFTASRKVGPAVARNRARRRLKALAGELLPAAGRPGYDYVLIARGETLRRPYIELAGDLETALMRLASGPGAKPGLRSGGKDRSGGRQRRGDRRRGERSGRGNSSKREQKRDREHP